MFKRFSVRASVGRRLLLLTMLVLIGFAAVTTMSLIKLRTEMMAERRAKVQSLVDGASSILAAAHKQQLDGKLTEAQAKKLAVDSLRQLRYEGSNYIFIYDTDYVRVMLPPAPETEGKPYKDLSDASGKLMLQEMIHLAVSQGSGFIDYTFPRPGQTAFAPKIAFIRYFPAWKWMLGTGVYVDDVDAAFWSAARIDILIAVAVLCAIGTAATLIARSIVAQLGGEPAYAAAVMRQVASGDLTARIALKRGDRGSLLSQLQAMIGELRQLLGEVRDSASSIDAASREIAQGNSDLSVRTEKQSSSLEATASTMEELTAAVNRNSGNSGNARELAQQAHMVASDGGAVVRDVIATMEAIRSSSDRIADIIGVINGIAFQTNILALNAAVEAARAGEQGRGFAVVAAEVRQLAQRSSAAATEIRELIGSSVAQVRAGSRLVGDAGRTMEEILASVTRVSELVSDIAGASGEQAQGIADVNEAISAMEQSTQQNAALVEQAAAASLSMQEQSRSLLHKVEAFTLD
ncbi:methyl-accepting chemotaxis protein [Noviherbaspirillum pedocola]|uniref:Cache domain-containing protein n=1 Tax=Noviherbaspirillum pedocola TaxID=2801341 RepID=A0A934SPV8_9BURK|nr:methyl-accepting chemotaxis protein [Noviherbaspirillum pedocola]MBK4734415.1 cache domain-containing protein [Noviherbaspirillum pedocola]